MLTWKKNFEEVNAKLELAQKEVVDLKTSFEVATGTIVKLTEENGELNARIEELLSVGGNAEQLAKVNALLEETAANLGDAITDNEGLKEAVLKLTAKVAELENKENDFSEAVGAKALEITQAQGVPPLSAMPSAQPASENLDGDLIRQLENIKNPNERRAFWVKNQKELTALLTKR